VPDAVAVGTDLAGAARKAAGAVRDAIGAAGERADDESSAVADVPVADVADPPVAVVAENATPPDVSDGPGRAAGRGQAARHRG
ncbi:MAG: hypothetical protein WEB51_06815, partial [Mycobacterium sp.]